MEFLENIEDLEALYGSPGEASLAKVADHLTPLYARWIMASKFCVLSTVGPDGTDGSPRGDEGSVVQALDAKTLLMPDWRGNNRMDSLRNIVSDGRVSLMFMIPGSNNVVRINGRARLTIDADILARFERKEGLPRSVIVIEIGEVYTQCARALMRSGTWSGVDESEGLPSAGDILREMTQGRIDGAKYDADWGARAAKTMWAAPE